MSESHNLDFRSVLGNIIVLSLLCICSGVRLENLPDGELQDLHLEAVETECDIDEAVHHHLLLHPVEVTENRNVDLRHQRYSSFDI